MKCNVQMFCIDGLHRNTSKSRVYIIRNMLTASWDATWNNKKGRDRTKHIGYHTLETEMNQVTEIILEHTKPIRRKHRKPCSFN
jgi:hypothetical protein